MMGIEETDNDGEPPSDYDDGEIQGESKREESEEEDLRDFNEVNILDELKSQNIQHLDSDFDKDKYTEPNDNDLQFTGNECNSNSPYPIKDNLSESHYKNKSKVPPLDFSKIHKKAPVVILNADKKPPINGNKMYQ